MFLKNNPRVRHYLNSPTSILEGLKRLRDDFEKLGVFISNSYQVFVNAYAILEKYCDVPTNINVPLNVGTREEPFWRYRSLVECFNKILNRIGLVHLSTRLGHAILTRVGYRFSQNEKLGYRGLNLLNGMTDPTRQNEFIRQQQRMNEKTS